MAQNAAGIASLCTSRGVPESDCAPSRIPASIEISIKLVVCQSDCAMGSLLLLRRRHRGFHCRRNARLRCSGAPAAPSSPRRCSRRLQRGTAIQPSPSPLTPPTLLPRRSRAALRQPCSVGPCLGTSHLPRAPAAAGQHGARDPKARSWQLWQLGLGRPAAADGSACRTEGVARALALPFERALPILKRAFWTESYSPLLIKS
jgi:hypothetical protein